MASSAWASRTAPLCGRSAPDRAWAVKINREPNGPTSRRKRSPSRPRKGGSEAESAELAKLRREVEQAKSDSIKQTREMRELRAAFEARADAPAVSQEVSGSEGKDELRKDIEKLQHEIRSIEALDIPELAGELAKKKLKLAALTEQRVQNQPTPMRLRGIEAAILKKNKVLEAISSDMADLDLERIRLGVELEKKSAKYTEHMDHVKSLQLERAKLLDRQAVEARGTVAAAAAAPPAPEAAARPSFEQAWAVLKGVHDECSNTDEERAIVARIGQRVAQHHLQQQQQQQQQLVAAAADGQIPVPTSPRGESGGLVGDNAAAGLDENSQEGGGTAPDVAATPRLETPAATQLEDVPASIPAAQPDPPTQDIVMATPAPVGNVLDREPSSALQAMEDQKRRRIQQ